MSYQALSRLLFFTLHLGGCICLHLQAGGVLQEGLHNRKELSDATPRGQSISLCGVLFLLLLHGGPLPSISIVYVLFFFCFFCVHRIHFVVCFMWFAGNSFFIQLRIHLVVYLPYLNCAFVFMAVLYFLLYYFSVIFITSTLMMCLFS